MATTSTKSVLNDSKQVERAVALIQLGARLQVLESETDLNKVSALDDIDAIMKAYRLYVEQVSSCGMEVMLTITRAWRLVKFVDNQMLAMTKCCKCGGHFVSEPYENSRHFECGLCNPPARAGKGLTSGGILLH